jgi:ketosteroid isomerase-like protein
MNFRLVTVLLFLLLLSSIAFGQSDSKDDVQIKSLIKRVTDAQLAYDPSTLDKIFASDYIEISPLGEFDPREKVLGFYSPEAKAAAGNMTSTVQIVEPSIRNYGRFAIAIVKLDYTMSSEGKPLPPRSFRAIFVFRKDVDAWKIASSQYTGIRPAAPPKQ